MDDSGYPTRMAADAAAWSYFFRCYLTDNDPYVIDWEGSGTVSLADNDDEITTNSSTINSNRKEVTFTSTSKGIGASFVSSVSITAITEGNHPTNIRVYRKSHEALINAGQICSPHFLARYSGWGRVRLMDLQWLNENQQVKWSHRPLPTDHSWIGGTLRKGTYCGTASQTGNAWVTASAPEGDPAEWTHGQEITFRLSEANDVSDVASFSKANPAVIGATGHPFVNGDTVFFLPGLLSGDFNRYTARKWFTVTEIDADSFSINLDSSGFSGNYTSGAKIAKQVTIAAGDLPAKRVINRAGEHISGQRWAAGDVRRAIYDSVTDSLVSTIGPTSGGVGIGGIDVMVPMGVPIEILIKMVNELQVNSWWHIPHLAEPDWIDGLCGLLLDEDDGVDDDLEISIEFSNEIWNSGAGFSQTNWAHRQAMELWPDDIEQFPSGLDFEALNNWYGYRFHQVMTRVDLAFTGNESRLNKVFSVWTAGFSIAGHLTDRFTAPLADLPTTPISLADSLAIAPYCEPSHTGTSDAEQVWKYKQGGAQRQEALEWLDARWRAVSGTNYTVDYLRETLFPAWIARANGTAFTGGLAEIGRSTALRLCQYEGGWGGIPSVNALTATDWEGEALLSSEVTITGAANNGSGAIRITASAAGVTSLTDGQSYWIELVRGCTEANGFWEIDKIDATHFDLVGSTFTNTYTAGGRVASDRDSFFYGYASSDLYARVLTENLQNFVRLGGEYPSQYCVVATWSSGGMWGCVRPSALNEAPAFGEETPAYDELISFNERDNLYRFRLNWAA
jgi:hypothetical protein